MLSSSQNKKSGARRVPRQEKVSTEISHSTPFLPSLLPPPDLAMLPCTQQTRKRERASKQASDEKRKPASKQKSATSRHTASLNQQTNHLHALGHSRSHPRPAPRPTPRSRPRFSSSRNPAVLTVSRRSIISNSTTTRRRRRSRG